MYDYEFISAQFYRGTLHTKYLTQTSNYTCIIGNIQRKLNRINFKSSANVHEYIQLLMLFIKINATLYSSINANSYELVMYMQKLYHL